MSRTVFTLRIDMEERLALENLSRIEGCPMNQLVNDAIKSYLRQWDRKKRSQETNLEDLRAYRKEDLRAYRKKDPGFKKAMEEFVEAEASLKDPIEGDLVEGEPPGPVQNKIRNIIDA
jgi:hypothetical protein